MSKRNICYILLFLLIVTGCSVNGLETSRTLRVVIQTGNSSQTVSNSTLVENLYEKTRSLPQVPTQQVCPAIAGPRYTLTFINNGKPLLIGIADASGCGSFTVNKSDVRQTDEAFWSLIHQALAIEVSS